LLVGFAVVGVLLLGPGLFAASRLAQLRHLAVEGRSGQAAAVASLGRMQAMLAQLDRLERSLVATSDSSLGVAAAAASDSLLLAHQRLRASPYGEQALGLEPLVVEIDSLSREIAQKVSVGRISEATSSLGAMISTLGEVERLSANVADSIDVMARQDFVRAEQLSESARARTLVGLLLAVLIAGVVVMVTTNTLTNPLRRLSRAMASVADGSFETPGTLPYERDDEIGELSRSLRTMTSRLEQLDRSKAEFLGMATHELKTPLNVIAGYAELIGDELGENASELHRGMINGVAEQAEIMARLVSRLMDISRLEAGTYRLEPEPVRVEDLMTGVTRMFERIAADKGVALRLHIADSAPERVTLDVDIVRDEVLGNLVANALRFAPSGGWITIDVEGAEGGVAFIVTDSGRGIDEEHRDFIFDKHYTVDRARAVGSGLGLAIAKEMVELHGGLITLDRGTGAHGARFRVALPLTPATPELEVPGYIGAEASNATGGDEVDPGADGELEPVLAEFEPDPAELEPGPAGELQPSRERKRASRSGVGPPADAGPEPEPRSVLQKA
jgi:signal transduction histidine kinase